MLIQAEVPCRWIIDSQRFLLEHFDAIQESPSNIYHSALPLCPASSWLCEHYSTGLSEEVKVVMGLPDGWGACSRTVSLSSMSRAHTSLNDIVAVSLYSHDIITVDAITGVHLSVLSGHTDDMRCITFSSDGTLLVSGDWSGIIKLWDIQTGGTIRTLAGHTNAVNSISISPDHSAIASGSWDKTVRLWNTWTGECSCVIYGDKHIINSVSFSPTNPFLLISASNGGTVQQWDTNGHKIGPAYKGCYVAFSSDGTHFVSWGRSAAVVQNSGSGAVIAELQVSGSNPDNCCFSPDGKFVAGCVGEVIYIWDITSQAPHPVETFVGHAGPIRSITFSPLLISSSDDKSIKVWQFSPSPRDPITTGSENTPLVLAPIKHVSLQISDDIVISIDGAGVARSWNISTGLCTASFQVPAQELRVGSMWGDMKLIDGRWIFAWHVDRRLHIWDTRKEFPHVIDADWESWLAAPRISGDGSKAFFMIDDTIQAWSVWTGEAMGVVELEDDVGLGGRGELFCHPLIVDGSRVWIHFDGSQTKGWDFGVTDSAPIPLSNTAPDSTYLELNIKWSNANPYRIKDSVTGNDIFQLSGRYANPMDAQWDGQYLVAGYWSGEVLILGFTHMSPQQKDVVCWPSHRCRYRRK